MKAEPFDNPPYRRPSLPTVQPRRGASGYYRAAGHAHTAVGGIPLANAEAAVVAAVRMGYKVAEAQVDRSARLAQRLRKAGDDAAGPDSELKAADATERLLIKSAMTGLSWLEAAAAEPGSPLKRLLAAEYRMLGAVFGLTPEKPRSRRGESDKDQETGSNGHRQDPPPPAPSAPSSPPPPAAAPAPEAVTAPAAAPALQVVHEGGDWRCVRVLSFKLDQPALNPLDATFHCVNDRAAESIEGKLSTVAKDAPAVLTITTSKQNPAGLWRAAARTTEGLQLAIIEIEL